MNSTQENGGLVSRVSEHTIKVAVDCAPALEAMRKFCAIYYPEQPLPKLSEIARVPTNNGGLVSRLVSEGRKDTQNKG